MVVDAQFVHPASGRAAWLRAGARLDEEERGIGETPSPLPQALDKPQSTKLEVTALDRRDECYLRTHPRLSLSSLYLADMTFPTEARV